MSSRPARRLGAFFLAILALTPALVAQNGPVSYVYDELGRLVGVIDGTGASAVYTYDAVGNLLSITRNAAGAVSIVEFTPNSGATGSTLTIYGTGFSTTPSQNTVTINGVTATVTSATANKLVVTVPGSATSGTIAVTTPGGSASSSASFTVAASPAPTITGASPLIGLAGAAVTVSGTNFQTNVANNLVKFNGTRTTVTSSSSTSIATTVPAQTGSGRITVATPTGVATGPDFYIPPTGFIASDVEFTARATYGQGTTVSITTANKIGLVVFDGTAGQRISLRGTNGLGGQINFLCDVNVSILKPNGSTLVTPTCMEWSGFIDATTLPVTGTYTVLIDPTNTATGNLTLTPYTVTDTSGSITAGGSSVTVSITTPGQNGTLTFSGTANQKVALRGTNGTIAGQLDFVCDVYVSILKPDNSVLASPTCMEWSGWIDTVTLPTTGTYTILVDPASTATGNLTLSLYSVTDATGTITPGGSAVTTSITTPGQNGVYTFSGTANQRVSLRGTSSTISGYIDFSCDVNVSIKKPDGSVLGSAVCMEFDGFIDVQTLPVTGTYTVFVDPVQHATGSLTVTLYDVPADASGTLTIGGGAVGVTITTAGQNGSLTFSGTQNQQVTVHVTSNTMSTVTVKLLKPDQSQLTSSTSSASSFDLSTQTLPTTGTYTVSIDPSQWNTGSMNVSVTSP